MMIILRNQPLFYSLNLMSRISYALPEMIK